MPNLATWMRPKDEKWFQPFFAKHPDIRVFDARTGDVPMDQMDGLLLTGGSDIAPEFLRQEIADPSLILSCAGPLGVRCDFEGRRAWFADPRHLPRYPGLERRARRHA